MKFICCAVGETRKGLDRFINIANLCPTHDFAWIGSCNIENDKAYIPGHGYFDDYVCLIPSNLKFYGLVDNPSEIMSNYDVFLFLSREDPCPLVIFEAKEIGLKVITLKESGDSHKYVSDDDIVIEGPYDENKIISELKKLNITKKIKQNYNFNSLESIHNVIDQLLFIENSIVFNRGWHEVEKDNTILCDKKSLIFNVSKNVIKNIEFTFFNNYTDYIKKIFVKVDDHCKEYDIQKSIKIKVESFSNKIEIVSDFYVYPMDINILDNRISGLRLSEMKINECNVNLNKIKKNTEVECSFDIEESHNVKDTIKMSHSGDLGDIIYSLPFLKSFSKKIDLYITNNVVVREKFDIKKFESLKSLLSRLNYINSINYNISDVEIDYDLDLFRTVESKFIHSVENYKFFLKMSLSEQYAFCFNKQINLDEKWIDLKEKIIIDSKPIIISRTSRYQNDNFPWEKIYNVYKNMMVFVGTKKEHKNFVNEIGCVDFYETNDLYSLAMVINGSSLFIGNQSCPYSIAEAMKKNTIQETSVNIPNCIFERTNGLYNSTLFEKINLFIKKYV